MHMGRAVALDALTRLRINAVEDMWDEGMIVVRGFDDVIEEGRLAFAFDAADGARDQRLPVQRAARPPGRIA